ncbi:MAG: endonuclease/exonuclease/phosphatase family protein [Cyclobacteriaceae bacterium]
MKLFPGLILAVMTMTSSAQSFTMMTYNIRLSLASDGPNAWDNRKENVAGQILFYEPDIFGIQEGLPEQVDYLDSALQEYNFIGVGRDDGARKGEFSAIYFKTDRLKLLQSGTFWLSPTPDKPSKGWDAAYPRVCTYGQFRDQESKEKFWVFNTHFDHVGDKARKEAAKLILKKIGSLNHEGLPVMLSGDLNLTPDQAAIRMLAAEMKDSRSASKAAPFGPMGTWNGFDFSSPLDRRIDYIFVSMDVKVNKYAVLTDSRDQKFYSDHLPVFVEVVF